MTNSLISMRNLEFVLWEWLDLDDLCRRPRFATYSRADLVAGWLWLEQAIVGEKAITAGVASGDLSFYLGRLRAFA